MWRAMCVTKTGIIDAFEVVRRGILNRGELPVHGLDDGRLNILHDGVHNLARDEVRVGVAAPSQSENVAYDFYSV